MHISILLAIEGFEGEIIGRSGCNTTPRATKSETVFLHKAPFARDACVWPQVYTQRLQHDTDSSTVEGVVISSCLVDK